MSTQKKDATSSKTPKSVGKEKSKGLHRAVSTEEPTKPRKEISLNFKLSSIENLMAYSKKVHLYDFKIEVTHRNIVVNPSANVSGEMYICPCANDDDNHPYKNEVLLKDFPTNIADASDSKRDNTNLDFMYSITIDPTNINDINRLADTPLLVTLYSICEMTSSPKVTIEEPDAKSLKSKPKQGNKKKPVSAVTVIEDDPEPMVTKKVMGYAFIDLMNFVGDSAVAEVQQIYIYPIEVHAELRTPIITVEISSEEPLCQLAEQFFCNYATITMEHIFNPSDLMLSSGTKVFVDFSLLTKYEIEGNHDMEKIATFSQGTVCRYQPNELLKKWNGLEHIHCIGLLTNINVNNNLSGLYNSQDVDLSVVKDDSFVIRYNSICRKMLTNEICNELEHLINYNEQQIFVEVHFESSEQVSEDLRRDLQSKYNGVVDLSPLLFPEVNTGRFVVPLKKINMPDISESPRTKKKQKLIRAPPPKIPEIRSPTTRKINSIETIPITPTDAFDLRRDISAGTINSKVLLKDTKSDVASMKELPLDDEEVFLIFEVAFETSITGVPKEGKPIKSVVPPNPKNEITSEDETALKVTADEIELEFEEEIVDILKNLPYHLEAAGILPGNGADIVNEINRISYLKEMQSNMVNTIMKLVAVKYNNRRNTNNNSNFKNLLADVYNNLTDRIMQTVNDYFSGADNRLDLKERERKDLYVFLIKEFHEFEYKSISEYMYIQKLNDPVNCEENLFDMAINDLENFCYDSASEKVQELLLQNPKHVYGLLIEAYIEFMTNGLENVYSLLFKIIQECPDNVETWALLYVLYKNSNYRAGYKHAKTMYEEKSIGKLDWLPYFSTRKEPYFDTNFDPYAPHNCIYIFLKLGTYQFADILYDSFKDRIQEKEQIIITSAMYLLTKQYEIGLVNLLNFKPTPSNDMLLRLYKGHFLYAMDKRLEAIREYQVVFHSPQSRVSSQIANLRCGFWDINEKKYHTAKTYFSACSKTMGTFLSWYGLGICFFRTNQFKEAELCFSKATDLYKPFPEVWMYLAVVNLKLNKTTEATMCFETARKYNVENVALWDEMINCFHENDVELPALF